MLESRSLEKSSIYQVVYASKVTQGLTDKDLMDILEVARNKNQETGITGALIYNEGFFLQLLEGEQEKVNDLYKHIENDTRHEHVTCIFQGIVEKRVFPNWYMGFFQDADNGNIHVPDLINFYDHPAGEYFREKLFEARQKLHGKYQLSDVYSTKTEISWIVEEICSPSMRLIFDMAHDEKFAFHTLRLTLGLDSLSVGVVITDITRKIVYINDSAVTLLKNAEDDIQEDLPDFKVQNLIGTQIDLFHKNPSHLAYILDNLEETAEFIVQLGGHLISIKSTIITDKLDKNIGYMAEIEDITTLERNKADLHKSIEKIRSLNHQINQMQKIESIGRLTSGIAHDFNNILNGIMGYNQLNQFAADDCQDEQLKEEISFNTRQVEQASLRASELIKKMMAFARQDPTEKAVNVRPTQDVINEVLDMMRPALTRLFQINANVFDGLNIDIDATGLHQILTNLIVNSRDAMKNGGVINVSLKKVTIEALICTDCTKTLHGEFIELQVSDHGTGITPSIIENIFDPFFTTKEVGEGTGLGLSTVSYMVHEAQGHIIVESKTIEPNRGTAFRLLFPLVNVA